MNARAALAVATAITASAAAVRAEPTGRVLGKIAITDADGKPAVGVDAIVYLVGFDEAAPNTTTPVASVIQQGRTFKPELVAITVGEVVAFPNSDPFFHDVFSESPSRKFDLGSYKKGELKTKNFPAAGVVDVYCNIHPEMAATILVLPNRHHVRTGADGSYVLDGVKPGTWTVFAYTRRVSKPASAKVTVTAGADTKLDLAIVRGAPVEHLNKYGEHYKAGATYH